MSVNREYWTVTWRRLDVFRPKCFHRIIKYRWDDFQKLSTASSQWIKARLPGYSVTVNSTCIGTWHAASTEGNLGWRRPRTAHVSDLWQRQVGQSLHGRGRVRDACSLAPWARRQWKRPVSEAKRPRYMLSVCIVSQLRGLVFFIFEFLFISTVLVPFTFFFSGEDKIKKTRTYYSYFKHGLSATGKKIKTFLSFTCFSSRLPCYLSYVHLFITHTQIKRQKYLRGRINLYE